MGLMLASTGVGYVFVKITWLDAPDPEPLHSRPGAQMSLPLPSWMRLSRLRRFPWTPHIMVTCSPLAPDAPDPAPLHSKPGMQQSLPDASGCRNFALRLFWCKAQMLSAAPVPAAPAAAPPPPPGGAPAPATLHSLPGTHVKRPLPSLIKQSGFLTFPWTAHVNLPSLCARSVCGCIGRRRTVRGGTGPTLLEP